MSLKCKRNPAKIRKCITILIKKLYFFPFPTKHYIKIPHVLKLFDCAQSQMFLDGRGVIVSIGINFQNPTELNHLHPATLICRTLVRFSGKNFTRVKMTLRQRMKLYVCKYIQQHIQRNRDIQYTYYIYLPILNFNSLHVFVKVKKAWFYLKILQLLIFSRYFLHKTQY